MATGYLLLRLGISLFIPVFSSFEFFGARKRTENLEGWGDSRGGISFITWSSLVLYTALGKIFCDEKQFLY